MEISRNLLDVPVLGLSVNQRTAKCQAKNGHDFKALFWPPHYHLDPDFISWLIHNPHIPFEEALKQVPSTWWQEIKTKTDLKIAEAKLLKNIQNKTEGWVAPRFNKPISFALTRSLIKTPITPNQITFLNLGVALTAFFLLIHTSYAARILGALVMQFSSIVDGCDGEVARLKLMTSRFGAWADTVMDDVANNLFFCALFLGLSRSGSGPVFVTLGWVTFGASVCVSVFIYQQLIVQKRGAHAKDFNPAWNEGKKGSWFDRLRPVMKRDFFVVVMLVFFILDLRVPLFWISVIGTWATFFVYGASFVMELKARFH
jgi:phosphatidylglycerophosphate synthase